MRHGPKGLEAGITAFRHGEPRHTEMPRSKGLGGRWAVWAGASLA
jgi:hypothetical protein